jgi:cell division protein YceG involved in septum cleavage
MKKLKKIILEILALCVALTILFFVLLVNYSISSMDKKNINVLVDIPTGSSFLEVKEKLNQAGLIKNRIFFYSLAMIKKARRHICAGEYTFNTSMTPAAMIDKLIRGDGKECMSSNGFGQTCLELRDGFSTHIYLSCNFSKSPRPFLLPS